MTTMRLRNTILILLAPAALLACTPMGGRRGTAQADATDGGFVPGTDGTAPADGTDGTDPAGTNGTTDSTGAPPVTDAPPNPGDGTLIGEPCSPGAVDCNGTSVVVCVADGAGWTVSETCTGATKCDLETGTCVCAPNCANKVCGDDGCGGSCGTCPNGGQCTFGECGCTPSCAAKQCGQDGCGGQCGTCGIGESCTPQGICQNDDPGGGAVTCAPNGTGFNVGAQVKDISWNNAEGQSIHLHDYCQAEGAVILVETAAW